MSSHSGSKLLSFREYRNLGQHEVASVLGISKYDYDALESGEKELDRSVAQKLADLYNVPLEYFTEKETVIAKQADVLFTHCTFSGNTAGGYINHQYNDSATDLIISTKNDEIKTLKEQIKDLQKANSRLVELLGKDHRSKWDKV